MPNRFGMRTTVTKVPRRAESANHLTAARSRIPHWPGIAEMRRVPIMRITVGR